MIVDRIENLKLYIPYNAKLAVVCDYLAKTVVVNAFTPKEPDAAKWETHRKYIDLQYLIEGDETMGYLHIDEMEDAEYNEEKVLSYPVPKADADMPLIPLKTGHFAFLEPRDAHRPSAKLHATASKKLIFKIPVEA